MLDGPTHPAQHAGKPHDKSDLDREAVTYQWDAAGRLQTVTDPQGAVTRYRYDAAGRRSRVEYGNGTAATWAHDAAGQVLSIVYANQAGEVLTAFGYGYDAAGNRTYKAFADGTRESYGYDAVNRLTSVDYPSGRHVDYGYDPVGNRLALVDTSRSGPTQYAASAVASSGGWSAGGAIGPEDGWAWSPWRTTGGPQWLEVTFQEAWRAKSLRVKELWRAPFVGAVDLVDEQGGSHRVYEGGDTTTYGGWLEVKVGGTAYKVKKARIWTDAPYLPWLGSEQVDAVKLEGVYEESYSYNGFNQLVGVTGNDGGRTAFGYDGNGNQVTKTVTPSGGTAQATQYAYDPDDRLAGVVLPGGGRSAYEYDANGLRTKKTDSSGTTQYLLDGLSVAAQYAADGTRQAFYTQSLARIDEVLSVVNSAGKYWYQADALGSVYTLTTASGIVQARGGYDVFGEPRAEYGASVGQPFGFTGREHDLDSALVYSRQRYLNPSTGKWTQPDPLGSIGGLNHFNYVSNSPANATDPFGLYAIGAPVTTVTMYAWLYPIAFLMLLADLGAQVKEMNETAMMISNAVPYVLSNCKENKQRKWTRFYRAMSVDDAAEFRFGIINSKMVRAGGDMEDVIRAHWSPSTAVDHVKGGNTVPGMSPYVSTTLSLGVAFNKYANTSYTPPNPGDRATGRVVALVTRRDSKPGDIDDFEFLFLYAIGVAGESLYEVDRHGNPILQ